jgi:IclR family acetate operon transcriptional repressor
MDLHCSAVGKCLLAFLPEPELLRVVRDHGLTRYNENTITSIRKLRQQAADIKRFGFAVEDEEGEIGCRCVGAPIYDHCGTVIAAISVAGTTAQIRREDLAKFGGMVRQTAAEISEVLGFNSLASTALAL